MSGTVGVQKVLEYTIHPFGRGNLTKTGVAQYSQLYNSSVASNFTATNAGPFNVIYDPSYPGYRGLFKELELELIAEFQGNATTLMEYRWEGRNLNPVGSWVAITSNVEANVTAGWTSNVGTLTGYVSPADDFNSVPFEIRMQFKTNHANVGLARVNAASSAHCIYQIT